MQHHQRRLVKELAQWLDYADWSDAERCVRWRFEMPQAQTIPLPTSYTATFPSRWSPGAGPM